MNITYIVLGTKSVEFQERAAFKAPWEIYAVIPKTIGEVTLGLPPFARVTGLDSEGKLKLESITEGTDSYRKIDKWVRGHILLNNKLTPRSVVPEETLKAYFATLDSRVLEQHYENQTK